MATKDAAMVRADETKTTENGPSTAAASVGDDLGPNRNRAKPSEADIDADCQTGKVNGSEQAATTGTPGFRMKLYVPSQQHVRKRKRSVTGGAASSSLNVFGDEEDDTKTSRTHKLLTMSLSGSSSSSDEEDGPSLSKTGSSNKDTNVNSDEDNHPESRRPQHEPVQTSSGNHGNNNAQDAKGQNESENKSSKIVKEHVVAGTNNGDSSSTKIDSDHPKKDHIAPNNESQQQQQQQQHQFQHQRQQQQPEGWRVKLYRLNADGSWDDCGTGRILCLYKPKPPPSAQNTDHKNDSPTAKNITNISGNNNNNNNDNESNLSSYNSQSSNSNDPNSDSAIYVELGEPTLCMHSEISNAANRNNNTSPSIQQQPSINHNNNVTNSNENNTGNGYNNPRILLRTRILLRDAYQRQGDNIITWCEPYLEEGNPAQGVDLALSFQDNAGCIDIWRQITQVQSKANEKFRLRQQQQQNTNSSGNSTGGDGTKASGDVLENNQSHGRSLADLPHNMATALRPNLHQQQQELWANAAAETDQGQPPNGNANNHNNRHASNSNNSNNDDHHAFEDAMGGIVAAYRDAAGGSTNANTNALGGGGLSSPQLPNPPTVEALEEITDTIATVQVRDIRFENSSISEKRKKQTNTRAFAVSNLFNLSRNLLSGGFISYFVFLANFFPINAMILMTWVLFFFPKTIPLTAHAATGIPDHVHQPE
jgi:hypothetical protein